MRPLRTTGLAPLAARFARRCHQRPAHFRCAVATGMLYSASLPPSGCERFRQQDFASGSAAVNNWRPSASVFRGWRVDPGISADLVDQRRTQRVHHQRRAGKLNGYSLPGAARAAPTQDPRSALPDARLHSKLNLTKSIGRRCAICSPDSSATDAQPSSPEVEDDGTARLRFRR